MFGGISSYSKLRIFMKNKTFHLSLGNNVCVKINKQFINVPYFNIIQVRKQQNCFEIFLGENLAYSFYFETEEEINGFHLFTHILQSALNKQTSDFTSKQKFLISELSYMSNSSLIIQKVEVDKVVVFEVKECERFIDLDFIIDLIQTFILTYMY